MVYYRKYRPQQISELDLDTVREKLSAILSSKELPHAFLFTGSKGLGKTSAARILAKAINCTEKGTADSVQGAEKSVQRTADKNSGKLNAVDFTLNATIEPCNECLACVSITNGSNIDVLEIDAASNGGVEEIRTLRERVKFAPSALRKKVYIIDEVHMLSTGAFNALLKTLEEPPSHVVFVLATTELWKLPPTIVSRTFQVQFEKPTSQQMARSLSRIVKGEGLTVDDHVLEKVAEISDGAFRDAAKNLEELALSARGSEITVDLFEKTFRTFGIGNEVYELLQAYEGRNAKKALQIIASLSESGADFKVILERLVDHLRGLLMMRNDIQSEEKDIKGLTVKEIQELLELSNEAFGQMKYSIIPELPLELMTVKFCILDVDGIQNESEKMKDEKLEKDPKPRMPAEALAKKTDSTTLGVEPLREGDKNILSQLMEKVNVVNKPAAALLRSCHDAVVSDLTLTISTPFPIHADRLKSEKVLPDLISAAEKVVGRKVEVVVQILKN